MNWLLIVVLAILIISVILGITKGFVKMLVSIISVILSIILTVIFAPVALNWVENNTSWETDLAGSLEKDVIPNFTEAFGDSIKNAMSGLTETESKQVEEMLTNGKEVPSETLKAVLEKLMSGEGSNLSVTGLLKTMFGSVEEAADSLSKDLAGQLAAKISHAAITAACYLVVLILAFIVVSIIGSILNLAAKIPGIRTVNRFLGGVFGFIEGFLTVDIILLAISLLSFTGIGTTLMSMVQESAFLTLLNNNNIFLMVL